MIRLGMMLIGVLFAGLRCAAQPACTDLALRSSIDAVHEDLTLADLLPFEACAHTRQAASHLSLGKTPRAGSVRIFEGSRIRRLIEELTNKNSPAPAGGLQIPERIVVRRAGGTKSCAEIAAFLASATLLRDVGSSWAGRENLECAAVRGVSEDAQLEVMRSTWNTALQRWEFLLRCAHPEDCVPFLVSTREEKARPSAGSPEESLAALAESTSRREGKPAAFDLLVKPGETATLIWEQAGIRAVLPVTCLDAGELGQFVRVRLKNVPRILRAEVVGNRAVQVRL